MIRKILQAYLNVLQFADIKMTPLSEGEISSLHIGLKGTMNTLFLKDLADKRQGAAFGGA